MANNNEEEEQKKTTLGRIRVYALLFGAMLFLFFGFIFISDVAHQNLLNWVVVGMAIGVVLLGIGISPYFDAWFSGMRIRKKEYKEPEVGEEPPKDEPTVITKGTSMENMWHVICATFGAGLFTLYGAGMAHFTQHPVYSLIGLVMGLVTVLGIVYLIIKMSHEEEVIPIRLKKRDAIRQLVNFARSENEILKKQFAYQCVPKDDNTVYTVFENEETGNVSLWEVSLIDPEDSFMIDITQVPHAFRHKVEELVDITKAATLERMIQKPRIEPEPKKEKVKKEEFEGQREIEEFKRKHGIPEVTTLQ